MLALLGYKQRLSNANRQELNRHKYTYNKYYDLNRTVVFKATTINLTPIATQIFQQIRDI